MDPLFDVHRLLDQVLHLMHHRDGLAQHQQALELVSTLVHAFYQAQSTPSLVQRAIQIELDGTEDAERLFRGESCATRILDTAFQRAEHNTYLRAILRVLVKKIATAEEAQLQVELEKGSGRTAEDCTQCFKFIISGIDRFVRRLQKNAFLVPLHVRVAFRALFEGIVAKFPTVDALQSCTSLFFLRVLCPALLNPSLYGVYVNSIPPTALRTLLLVSRILQSSANGQVPSSPFSNIINLNVIATVTIERYTPALRVFMESVCDKQTISELTKMQIAPTPKQVKALKRALRETRSALESHPPPPPPPPPSQSTASRISSTLGKLTKGRTVSQPIPPLSQSSPSKPKKSKSKSAKSSDSVSKGGKRARALTSHDVFGGVDDAASSTSTPPASPRPAAAAPPPGSTLFAAPAANPDGQSPSKRRMKLNLDSTELNTMSSSHRASSDGISWLVSPRNSTPSRPTTAEAKRKRLVNRMSTMLPKKSVLDEFDSMKQPT
eukprot:TRINITY_DN112_c0_g1_i1.p1 TRINITY_DN112_c0_g1~~TRINITY_DN112_c0_g1_i1.p1  ORF type:complete len:494 (-),score=72.32 TRINITY_DN112_c0_g1_i1:80-1561(-)